MAGKPNANSTRNDKPLANSTEIDAEESNEISKLKAIIAKKDKALAKKDKALAMKDKALAKKDKDLAKKDNDLAKKDKEINNLEMSNTVLQSLAQKGSKGLRNIAKITCRYFHNLFFE